MNLVLVEHADGVATDVSLQALALAAGLGGETHALLIGPGGLEAAPGVPVAVAHVAEHPALDAFAPDAWAAIICELAERIGATAVVAPGHRAGDRRDGPRRRSARRAARRERHRRHAGLAALADAPSLGRQPARGGASCTPVGRC